MAHHKRKRPRASCGGGYSSKGLANRLDGRVPLGDRKRWTKSYPRFWDILHHSRPARRKVRSLEASVLGGSDPDGICWPDGLKPHIYYW